MFQYSDGSLKWKIYYNDSMPKERMIGCKGSRIAFMKGYNAMLEAINPSAIICFGSPFPEMEGNIISVDYLSSRKVERNGR